MLLSCRDISCVTYKWHMLYVSQIGYVLSKITYWKLLLFCHTVIKYLHVSLRWGRKCLWYIMANSQDWAEVLGQWSSEEYSLFHLGLLGSKCSSVWFCSLVKHGLRRTSSPLLALSEFREKYIFETQLLNVQESIIKRWQTWLSI